MNRYLILALSLSILCTAPSCKLYRRITGKQRAVYAADSLLVVKDSATKVLDTTVVKSSNPDFPTVDPAQQALLAALLSNWTATTPWRTFNGKAKAHYEGKGEDHNFTANIRMEKDKRIWVSVVGLGVYEVARLLITPDTVQILNRINKEARILPFSQISSLLPVRADFASLQSLIIGDAMKTVDKPNVAKDTAGELILSYVSPELTHTLQYSKKDTSLQMQAISESSAFLLSQYADYTLENGRRFSTNRLLTMTENGEQHTLSLEFNKIAFDEGIETPFSIPEKYERK